MNEVLMNTNSIMEQELVTSMLSKKLFDIRTITIFGEINQEVSQNVAEKLILLSNQSDDVIKIYINSPGGHVESADTIFDMIQFIKAPVKIIGSGWVASAGAYIFCAPSIENRFCLPHTRFLLHQPSGGVGGQATDIKIEAQEIIKMRKRLNQILAKQTGQSLEKVEKDTDRNFWMTAEEAKEYGLVGKIITTVDKL
jgi:ATP-dependent Clp protease, protease subunit